MLTLLLFLGLAEAEGAKTVWVDPYTRKDGTYVQGHFRSPPSVSTASSVVLPAPVSTYEQQNSNPHYSKVKFERGFLGDQPFIKLTLGEWGNSLEFSCVKTPDDLVRTVEWVQIDLYTKEGRIQNQTRRTPLDNVNVWIGDKVHSEVTMTNAFDVCIDKSHSSVVVNVCLNEISGEIHGRSLNFHRSKPSKEIKEFIDTCKYLEEN